MVKFATYRIVQGDTLRPLAQKLLGDFNRWTELVSINKLNFPYIVDDSSDPAYVGKKVLGIGEVLLYHAPSSAVNPPSVASKEEAERIAYGTDFLLVDGYFQISYDVADPTPLEGGATLSLVSGINNLAQAVFHRLNTDVGGLPAHPTTYGHTAREHIGELGTPESLSLVKQTIQRCLAQDSRLLKSVVGAEQEQTTGKVTVDANIEPKPPSQVLRVSHTLQL